MHYHQHLQAHNKRTRPLYRLVNSCFLGYTCPSWRFAESSCRIGIAAVRPGDLYIIVDGPENRRILVESKYNNNTGEICVDRYPQVEGNRLAYYVSRANFVNMGSPEELKGSVGQITSDLGTDGATSGRRAE